MSFLAVITLIRTHWKLAALGLMALLLAVQTVRLSAAHHKIERREIDIREMRFELDRISSRKNEQKRETVNRIERAERGNREADERAREIEASPLPGNCVTPKAVLEADV